MWGPDKYVEETPELMAAIDELRHRLVNLDVPDHAEGLILTDGISITRTWRFSSGNVHVTDGYYIEARGRRVFTLSGQDPAYVDPVLLMGSVLPALRQIQVLDDIVHATKESDDE